MDDNAFNQYKERIGVTITKRLNDAYQQQAISEEDAPIAAQFILDNIDKATNHAELMSFLEELALKWTVFGPILISERMGNAEEKNQETVGQIEQLIKENRIDEAMQTAEQANNNNTGGLN